MSNLNWRRFWERAKYWDLTNVLSDKTFVKIEYRNRMRKKLNLKNPQTFNEKLQWLKIYDRKPIYTTMVDKYEVKNYVADKIGDEYIIPTLGVWDSFDEIDFDSLPDQFVLKCTHDSGGLVICKDKSKLDKEKAKKKIELSLNRNYYYHGREWAYKDVKPRVIAEKLIDVQIVDYKFYCFNGEPKLLYLSRGLENHATASISFFDLDLKRLPFHRSDFRPFTDEPEIPEGYQEMLEIVRKLSNGMSFIRVDLYNVGGKIYFSELTFYPCAGYMPFAPKEWDYTLGQWIELPTID